MKATDPNCMDKEDLRHLSDAELQRMGVRLLNRQDVVLQCRHCSGDVVSATRLQRQTSVWLLGLSGQV